MDICGIFSGLIVAAVAGISAWGWEMLRRPSLSINLPVWKKRKVVYKWEKEVKSPYAFTDRVSGISVSTQSSTSSEIDNPKQGDVYKIAEVDNFDFYGITIKNEESKIPGLYIRTAEIKRTKLTIQSGAVIECRWWTRDYSGRDKLFPAEFDISKRREVFIPSGTQEHMVFAYRKSESNEYFLFGINTDDKGNFWRNEIPLSGFPTYGLLEIFMNNNKKKVINLEFYLDVNSNNDLSAKEIRYFPETVLLKEENR